MTEPLFRTSCELCIFRKDSHGCAIDLIPKYEVQGVVDKQEDFNIINRVCMFRRHVEWMKENGGPGAIYQELSIPMTYVILVKEEGFEEEGFLRSLESVGYQDGVDQRVVVALPKNTVTPSHVMKLLKDNMDHSNYYVCHLQDDDLIPSKQLDQVFPRVKNGYYTLIESGEVLPQERYHKLWTMVYSDVEQVVAVLPEEGLTGITIMCVAHQLVNGNKGASVIEKIWETAKEQDSEHLIKSWS